MNAGVDKLVECWGRSRTRYYWLAASERSAPTSVDIAVITVFSIWLP
jgi:hypothetical protein